MVGHLGIASVLIIRLHIIVEEQIVRVFLSIFKQRSELDF